VVEKDRRSRISFPDPLELDQLEDAEDPDVFERVTAVPDEVRIPPQATRPKHEDAPPSGLFERSLEIDLSEVVTEPPPAPEPEALEAVLPTRGDAESSPAESALLTELRGRYATGDFSGALLIAEAILEASPENEEARRCAERCGEVLAQMYVARLGSTQRRLRVAVPADQIRWLSLDHREGFLLSLAESGSTVEEVLDMCGMPRLEALRILLGLLDQRVIGLFD
jgi:hypothetical protein